MRAAPAPKLHLWVSVLVLLVLWTSYSRANIPGGGTGAGASVTLTDNGTTATLNNGIVSIICTKGSAQITTINYTFNNTGTPQTLNLLSGNPNGGKLYWEHSNNQGLSFTYAIVVDPATNGGDYAEISLYSTTQTNMPFEVHYSMRRGSPGFYVAAIWTHGGSNGAFAMGECRDNIYAGSIFNWMSVDATRNKLMQVSGGTSIGVPTAPAECSLWTNGVYQGRYEDKYKYSAAFGDQRAWGWSSVGASGKNVGLWNVSASTEYYNGGPLKQELMCHIGTTILNMLNGGHYGMGSDGGFVAGETWSKVCGPYFIYCNNVSKANPVYASDTVAASQALYNDALAQAAAEATAWPYSWFSNVNYTGPANRGTVTGKIVINDSFNPNATASNLWVGLLQQPVTSTGTYDFQQWMKPYQFWVHTDANGNFSIPAVIAGSNYTLYAFGQGAPGTFMSQLQTGGNPPFLYNLPAAPAAPFAVTVTGGATTSLGDVVWTPPTRVGPTVFEIGYPDRTARKFRHGEDWWVGDIGPTPTSPSPVWTKFLEFPFDFPNGPNYVVGTSRWSTDWNFIQPVIYSSSGTWNSSSSTITFNLPAAPAPGTQASLFLGLASDYYTALTVTVNGTNLASASGLSATPSPLPSTGFVPTSSRSDGSVRESINGAFSDERLTFLAATSTSSLLKAGTNTITISQRQVGGTYFANHAMYDYLRLELANYVPPAPASVAAYPGNNGVLLSWPAVAGATSYKILRSTVSGSGYASIATGVPGPVVGSGPTNATYVDRTALNDTTYYYVVQSVNPVNSSANSAPSTAVTPSAGAATAAPAIPAGLTANAGSGAVTLNWTASTGASYYTVKRSTLTLNGGNSTVLPNTNTLNNITLTNGVTRNVYTDVSPTNGTLYTYTVSAANAVGASDDSAPSSTAIPTAPVPSAGPATLTATALQNASAGSITLNWPAVPGAIGYVVQVATAPGGPFTFLYSVSSLTATDGGQNPNTTYYYQVAATNSGGTSAFVTASAITPPAAPTNLAATPGDSRVNLSWTVATGAASYEVSRSTVSGGPYTVIKSGVTTATYTDTTTSNGATYYYVVASTGVGGTGVVSTEANATPIGLSGYTWTGSASTTWDTTTMNWLKAGAAATYLDGVNVAFEDIAATTAPVVISAAVNPAAVFFDNYTTDYTVNGSAIAGTAELDKTGSGLLTLNNVNTYTGGTKILGGTLALGVTGNTSASITGNIQIGDGATFLMASTGGRNFPSNAIQIGAGASVGFSSAALGNGYGGSLSGPADATLTLAGAISFSLSGSAQLANFNGLVVIPSGSQLRFSNTNGANGNGGGAATFQVNGKINTRNSAGAGGVALGGLTGNGRLEGQTNTTAGTVNYSVGSNNFDTTFSGVIANGANGTASLTKVGSGTLTLSGPSTYSGPTVVNAGFLKITGSLSGSTSLTVASGATLTLAGGSLSVAGNILNNGTLKLTGAPALSASGTFTNNGVIDLINGAYTLPANVVNNGTVLDSSSVKVQQVGMAGTDFSLSILGYAGHTYQLQRRASLTTTDPWQNAGPAQTGAGTVLQFTDPGGATGASGFYRVLVGL